MRNIIALFFVTTSLNLFACNIGKSIKCCDLASFEMTNTLEREGKAYVWVSIMRSNVAPYATSVTVTKDWFGKSGSLSVSSLEIKEPNASTAEEAGAHRYTDSDKKLDLLVTTEKLPEAMKGGFYGRFRNKATLKAFLEPKAGEKRPAEWVDIPVVCSDEESP